MSLEVPGTAGLGSGTAQEEATGRAGCSASLGSEGGWGPAVAKKRPPPSTHCYQHGFSRVYLERWNASLRAPGPGCGRELPSCGALGRMVPPTSSTADGSKKDGGQVTSGSTSRVVPKRKPFRTGGTSGEFQGADKPGARVREYIPGTSGQAKKRGPWPRRS